MSTLLKNKADDIRKWIFRSIYFVLGMGLVVAELVAIFNGYAGDTISESSWELLDAMPMPAQVLAFIVVSGFQAWFVVHIFRRIWGKL